MKIKAVTQIVIIATTVLILIYDVFAYLKGGNPATISGWFWEKSEEIPMIPFMTGVLMGHLFWSPKDKTR